MTCSAVYLRCQVDSPGAGWDPETGKTGGAAVLDAGFESVLVEETLHKAVFLHPSLGQEFERRLRGLGRMSRGLGRSFRKRGPMRRLLEPMLCGQAKTP